VSRWRAGTGARGQRGTCSARRPAVCRWRESVTRTRRADTVGICRLTIPMQCRTDEGLQAFMRVHRGVRSMLRVESANALYDLLLF